MRTKEVNVQMLVLTALFVALTAVGAFIKIPAGAVPFTLQILFTFLAGILLGPGRGALSQLIYVLLGLVGVPVFTGGGGLGYVLQPTFGFLLGLIPCAAVTGALARGSKRVTAWRMALACAAGLAALYAVGLPYLALIRNVYLGGNVSAAEIVRGGMLIFLPWDALKVAAAVILSKMLLPVLEREMKR